ncbi:hypothetical protein [Clostridium acetobutylicum]|uniref:hypothetical protein n=1 Tax=Clostridium acetobutylicum TaxID=1488 RepID=UPI001F4C2987|nr:hypothetical protein [Clostridium acetobutylicum]NRY56451.1 hypothetical protein [Clostridium acetobutylicum]
MIFKDVVNYYNELAEKSKYLLEFKNQILQVKAKYIEAYTYILDGTITSGVNASNVESAKNQVTNMVACIQVEARKVNLMEIGKVINEIYQVKKDKASKLLNSIENCSNWIYNFSNMPSIAVQQIESFIKSIDTAVKEIDNIFIRMTF